MLSRFALIACFITLSGCLGSATQMVKSVVPTKLNANEPIIAQIGKEHKASLLAVGMEVDRHRNQSAGLGLISHPELESYINAELDKLKKAAGFDEVPAQAYVFADTSFGARVSADGNIYIPYSVILDLDSTDELAALLAHELSHTIRGHSSSDIFVKVQKKALAASALIANMRKTEAGVLRESDLNAIHKTMASLLVSDGFINPGWTRLQESEADKLGLDIMLAAGYNPDGMFVLLDKVAQWEEKNREYQQGRDALMEKTLGSIQLTEEQSAIGRTLNSYFNQGATRLGAAIDGLSKSHDSADSRYDTLLEYVDQHYAELVAGKLETRRWQAVAHNATAKAMLVSLQNTGKARDAIVARDYRSAEQLIRRAARGRANNQNFLRQTFYELRSAQSRRDSMQQNLKIGMTGQYPSLFLHVEQVKLQQQNSKQLSAAATEELISVFDAYGRPADYYTEVVTLLSGSGAKSQVLALQAECMVKYAGEGVSCNAGGTEADQQGNDLSYKGMMKSFW